MLLCILFSELLFTLCSDFDDDDSGSMSTDDGRRSLTHSPNPHAVIKKNKRPRLHSNQHQQSQQRPSTRVQELKAEARRSKREKEEGKKVKKKVRRFSSLGRMSCTSRNC